MAVEIKKVHEKEKRNIHLQVKAVHDDPDLNPIPQPDITHFDPPQFDEATEPGSAGGTKEVVFKLPDNVTTPGMIDETSPISTHIEEIIFAANLNPSYNYTFKYNGRKFDPNANAVVMHVNDGDQIEIVQI